MAQLDPPFRGSDMKALYKNVIAGKFQPISPIYSAELRKLINSCLEVDPFKRPTSMDLLRSSYVIEKVSSYRFSIPKINKQLKLNSLSEKALT